MKIRPYGIHKARLAGKAFGESLKDKLKRQFLLIYTVHPYSIFGSWLLCLIHLLCATLSAFILPSGKRLSWPSRCALRLVRVLSS